MNFGLRVAMTVETLFAERSRLEGQSATLYQSLLQEVLNGSDGLIWAGGDLGLGDIILIIDADTRIPPDCFLDAVKEFSETPELAILQHVSSVLQVANDYWEDCMAYFTKSNYFGTRYIVSSGDLTPFFGHNAFLRWRALENIATRGEDGQIKWWSEEHVSEDFEMALKLQSAGYTTRMAAYSGGAFKEGVSLTVYDEILRWEKYAYGVSELMFHPFPYWLKKGPLTPLFKQFLNSNIDIAAKCSSLFYMGTYFAIGSSWVFAVVNYFVLGWLPFHVKAYYVDSFEILVSILVVFSLKDSLVGPFVRYRMKEVSLWQGLRESMKNFVTASIFFQGLSMHVSKALVLHLCGFKMSWAATSKSLERHTMSQDLPMIWSRFRYMYLFAISALFAMLVLAMVVPVEWRITQFKAIFPLLWMLVFHAINPFLLNTQSYLNELLSLGNVVRS